MPKERFTTDESPFIRVDFCQGSLIVRGWAESSLEIRGEFQTHESDKGYLITSQGNLRLSVPGDAILSVGRVDGDLNVRHATGTSHFEYVQGDAVIGNAGDIELGIVHGDLVARNLIGALSVSEVNGDVVARGIREATLQEVHGDLSARVVDGNVTVESINGDADLRTVNGDVSIEQGFRDVNLNGVSGTVNVNGVTGDIRLRGGLTSGDHSLTARGDIVVRWPSGKPINLNVSAVKIDNRLPLDDVTEQKGNLSGRIGKSDTNLALIAEGRVILRESDPDGDKNGRHGGDMDFEFGMDLDDISTRIEAQVNDHLARVTREMETMFGEDVGRRVSEKVARRTEKAAERARRRAESRGRTVGFDFSSSPPTPPKQAVSTEEQLKILKMVETGKISPEEGRMLLEALEG